MKIVLFDIDDTLLTCPRDSNRSSSKVMFKKVFNLDADEDLIYTKGKPDRQIITEVIRKAKNLSENEEVEVPQEAHRVWAKALEKILKEKPPLILPGVMEMLDVLSNDKNIVLGIMTGNSKFRGEVKIKAANLDKYFKEGIYGGGLLKRSGLIEIADQELGKGTYIIVDDSVIAGQMAKENNVPIILVATGGASEKELEPYSEWVFKDFGEGRWKEVVKILISLGYLHPK